MVNIKVFLAVLLLIQGVEAFKPADGVSNSSTYFEVMRNPFTGGVRLGGVVVVIHTPLGGVIQYDDTQLLNYSVSGGSPPYICRYRINNNLWNNLSDCDPATVTFPLGNNVVIVEATDSLGVKGYDIIVFWLEGYIGMVGDITWIYLFLAVLIFFGVSGDKKLEDK